MSLLVLMYHRARAGRHGNPAEMLEAHFALIERTYAHVLPGEPLTPGALNVCLTFDDGYFDFYATVLPLLRKYRLRAVLAIPPLVVRDAVEASAGERLEISADAAFAEPGRGGFCTWSELAEIVGSGLVRVAAHGYTHCRLDEAGVDLDSEIEVPRTVLAGRLGQPVDSLVFPYGRFSSEVLWRTRRHYRYAFRIGGALNAGWDQRVLYRVDADRMASPGALFARSRLLRYRARYFWNRVRGA